MKRTIIALSVFALVGLTACETQFEDAVASFSLEANNAFDVLPADPDMVGMMDFQALQANDKLNPFSGESFIMDEDAGEALEFLDKFIEETGFDPSKDLDEVYVAVEGNDNHEASIVAYATYEPDRLHTFIEENFGDEVTSSTYRGVKVYAPNEEEGDPRLALANENMVLIGSSMAALEGMLDRVLDGGDALSGNAATMSLIAEAATAKTAWMVAEKPTITNAGHSDAEGIEADFEQLAYAVRHISLGVDVLNDGVDTQVKIYPTENVSAEDLEALVKGLVAAVKVSPELDEEQLAFLDGIDINERSSHVSISTSLDNDFVDMVRGH